MKISFTLILKLLTCFVLYAQDTVIRNNSSEKIPVVIREVTDSEIVFRKMHMLEGPDYRWSKRYFSTIIYSDGTRTDLKEERKSKSIESAKSEMSISEIMIQTAPGKVLMTGTLCYVPVSSSDNRILNSANEPYIEALFQLGIFTKGNAALGAQIGYENITYLPHGLNYSDFVFSNYKNLLSIGAFLRPYKRISNFAAFYTNMAFNYQQGTLGYYSQGVVYENVDCKGFNITVRPGFSIFLSEKVALDIEIGQFGYFNMKAELPAIGSKPAEEVKSNIPIIELNMRTLRFGVSFHL